MLDKIGEYEVLAKLGEGGNGTVYAVAHPNTGVYLALKECVYCGGFIQDRN